MGPDPLETKMTESTDSFDLVVRALSFAAGMHRDQRRKNVARTPYIEHPIEVMRLLWAAGVRDPLVLAAALLHDTLEDTPATPEDLAAEFGADVAAIVGHVTDDKGIPKHDRKRLAIAHAPFAPPQAQLVKLADRIANCAGMSTEPPAGWSAQRIGQYYDWSRQVVDGLRGVHGGLEARFDAILAGVEVIPWAPVDSQRDAAAAGEA